MSTEVEYIVAYGLLNFIKKFDLLCPIRDFHIIRNFSNLNISKMVPDRKFKSDNACDCMYKYTKPCSAWIWFLQVNQWLTWLEQAEEDSDEED